MVCDSIFDALYTYDYFARPPRLIPNTAAGLPEITDGGRTFTIKVRPGIFFADDPAFKGKRRELVAEDYVYSIKRIFDPRVRSTSLYIFERELVGLDDVLARARRTGQFDYDAPIEGLRHARPLHASHPLPESVLPFSALAHLHRARGRGARSRSRASR